MIAASGAVPPAPSHGPTLASTPSPAPVSARDRVRPLMSPDVRDLIPDSLFNTRVGTGTVASEFDRAVSVRFEGEELPSQRRLVPETTTTQRLMASPAGPAFERLVRATLSVADAAQGQENLRSLTFLPDEHAAKAVKLLQEATDRARATQAAVADDPEAFRDRAHVAAKQMPVLIGRALAWNHHGALIVTPDASRRTLATIGAYRPSGTDDLLSMKPADRAWKLHDDWDTLVHETHHSITPTSHYAVDSTAIFEEAISTIFARRERANVIHAAGAAIAPVVSHPERTPDEAALGWTSWNRSKMPHASASQKAQAHVRYVDAPQVIRDLLHVAGVDLRTKGGFAQAYDLLQGRAAEHVPRRIADALLAHTGADPAIRERLVARVRRSVGQQDGARHVTDLLREAGGRT